MARKQSTKDRIRKKVAPTVSDHHSDPFHNGQTPTCRLLHSAIQDVFPELQQQMKEQTPTSELGRLLRWQLFQNRVHRSPTLPAPPLLVPPAETMQKSISGSKKKRRRKKKKKEVTAAATPATDALEVDPPVGVTENPSVQALDRSVSEMEELIIQETPKPPSLNSLPSDDNLVASAETGQSAATFFQQIQPQGSGDNATPQPPTTPPGTEHKIPQRQRSQSEPALGSITPKRQKAVVSPTITTSPTHEWIPEEDATPKIETPPGDVIKNPLEISYLLTLNDLDPPFNLEHLATHDSLNTTKILLEEWLSQLDDKSTRPSQKDFQSFVEFLQGKLRGGSQPLGIPLATLQDTISNIACTTCRADAMAEVEKIRQRPADKFLVLNPACLQDPVWNEDVDSAFDYVQLEEGYLPKAGENDDDSFRSAKDANLDHHIAFTVQAKKKTKHLFIESLTPQHLDNLVEEWLPCGLDEDVMVTTPIQHDNSPEGEAPPPRHEVLSSDDCRTFQQNILAKLKDMEDSLAELNTLGKELRQETGNATSAFGTSQPNLTFNAFPVMKLCDELCEKYMDKLFVLLRRVTSPCFGALADLQLLLWTLYLGALNKTLKACETYYSKVADELAEQNGAMPRVFLSADLRITFQSLVEEKVRIWTELGDQFAKEFTVGVLKEWCTRTTWESERAPPADDAAVQLDEECHKLIHELLSWTQTIFRGRVSDIQRQRMEQTEHVLEMLQSVVAPLSNQYATVEAKFSPDRSHYFASLRSNILLAQGVKKRMRLIDNAEVEGMTTGVILMWRHVRIMQSCTITTWETPPLPLQLKRWMLQSDNRLVDSQDPLSTVNSYHTSLCQAGMGGKRRVMCVLAGLVYRWMEEQCQEWKAEQAKHELLTDFDVAPQASSSNGVSTGKSGKKKKKKRNKQPSTEVSNNPTDNSVKLDKVAENSTENGTLELTEPKEANPTENGVENVHSNGAKTLTLATESNPVSQQPPETSVQDDANSATLDSPDQAPLAVEAAVPSDPTEEIVVDDDFQSCVYVEDGKTTMSAQDFLIGRLRDLIHKEGGNCTFI